MADAETILTEDRAAELLGVTIRQVRAWARRQLIPCRQLPNGTFLFLLSDLVRWIEQARPTGLPSEASPCRL